MFYLVEQGKVWPGNNVGVLVVRTEIISRVGTWPGPGLGVRRWSDDAGRSVRYTGAGDQEISSHLQPHRRLSPGVDCLYYPHCAQDDGYLPVSQQ